MAVTTAKTWKRFALTAILFALGSCPSFAQERTATITLGRDPEPPYCVLNPGGTVDIFWNIQHTTTPRFVNYYLQDPTRTINIEFQQYPLATGLNIARSWTVDAGRADGKYWVRVEFYSFEAGNEANAEVTFYVCTDMGNLCAYKWEDSNCNGILDGADQPVPGWWICIDTPNGDTICQITDAEGKVCFFGIPLGDYHVYEIMQPGWFPIGPTEYDVSLVNGDVQTVNFLNYRDDYCVGACCFPDGHCELIDQDDCEAAGGIYQGNNTLCEPNPCPQPLGACCFADGHCELLTEEDCLAAGGIFQGDFTDCDPNPCPQPTGACCFPDGHCEVLTEADCAAAGGVYYGNFTDCDPNPCTQPLGACCFLDGHCELLTEEDCIAQGGIFQGDFTDCEPNPCPQPLGACCFPDGHCEVLTEADCIAAGGTYYGNFTLCDPNPCTQPLGACCFPNGDCVLLIEEDCIAQGGIYQGDNTLCEPNPCPQPTGACCLADGSCVVLTEADCIGQGGVYFGDGVPCNPNPCPQLIGACCLPDGSCIVTTAADCEAHGGVYQGDGTNCNPPIPCPPIPTEETSWGKIKGRYR